MHRMTQDQLDNKLWNAVADNNIEEIKQAIRQGANVNSNVTNGPSLIQRAMNDEYTEAAALLKQHGGVK